MNNVKPVPAMREKVIIGMMFLNF